MNLPSPLQAEFDSEASAYFEHCTTGPATPAVKHSHPQTVCGFIDVCSWRCKCSGNDQTQHALACQYIVAILVFFFLPWRLRSGCYSLGMDLSLQYLSSFLCRCCLLPVLLRNMYTLDYAQYNPTDHVKKKYNY